MSLTCSPKRPTELRALGTRWCELAVKPGLDKLLGSVPTLKKAVASPAGITRFSLPEIRRSLRAA
jgi:hypothetical protein